MGGGAHVILTALHERDAAVLKKTVAQLTDVERREYIVLVQPEIRTH